MRMKNKKKSIEKNIWKAFQIALMLLTVLGIVKSLFVSLDIDESYAVAQAYRLVTGDKLIFDMWEPHQFSAFLPAILLFPFYKLFQTTDGCVLLLRILGTLIHLLIGSFLYKTAEADSSRKTAFILLVLHVNFLPKWITMPEFELMHYWCMILIFLLLYRYEHAKGEHHVIAAAFVYIVSGLCYPTMVLLFPLYFIGILRLRRKKGAVYFTLFTLIPTAIFLTVLITGMGLDTFIDHIGYIVSDPSHASTGGAVKWRLLLSECLGIVMSTGIALLASGVFTGILFFTGKKKKRKPVFYLTVLLSAASLLLSLRSLAGYLFLDENQFTTLCRYLPVAVLFLVIAIINRKETGKELFFGILPSLVSLPAVILVTNMGVNTAFTKLYPVVIFGLFMLGRLRRNREEEKQKWQNAVLQVSVLSLLLCLFFCKIPLIRVTGCLPVTVKAPLKFVQSGPAKGIFVPEKPAAYWEESYDVLTQLIPKDANVLYVGREQLFYVSFCKRVCTPSVQGTTVFNEIYADYYEVFPEKKPEIIVYDASFAEEAFYANPVNGVDLRDEWIREWMEENFAVEKTIEVGKYTLVFLEE